MPQLFDFAKPMLKQAGMVVNQDWDGTKEATFGQAKAQCRRENVKPATVKKWQTLGLIAATK